jgi:hypothetical protein
LNCEIHFGKIIRAQLQCVQRFVGAGAFRGVFGFDFLFQPAGAVLAGTASLTSLWSAFWGWLS